MGLHKSWVAMLINEKSFIQHSISELFAHPLITCKTTQNPIKAQNKLEDNQYSGEQRYNI